MYLLAPKIYVLTPKMYVLAPKMHIHRFDIERFNTNIFLYAYKNALYDVILGT